MLIISQSQCYRVTKPELESKIVAVKQEITEQKDKPLTVPSIEPTPPSKLKQITIDIDKPLGIVLWRLLKR